MCLWFRVETDEVLTRVSDPDLPGKITGFGFRVSGFGFRPIVKSRDWFGFRISVFGSRVSGLGFRVETDEVLTRVSDPDFPVRVAIFLPC